MLNQLRKAMIIIAVSKYGGGAYDDLPGTLNSSKRLRDWAEVKSPDRSYDVLTIDDSVEPVTVARVEDEVRKFLATRIIDRLIVYFGGHGAQQQVGQVWLLSKAAADRGEAIDYTNFKEGLRKANIGGLNPDIESGQIWIISDACRNPDIGFVGRPILTTGRRTKNVQFDIYHSCLSEDYSFHLDPTPARNYPHLLFTEALVDVLESAIPDTIEPLYHRYRPAMLNHLVAQFLRREVPARGVENRLDQDTAPDIECGFSPPDNYYVAPIDPAAAAAPPPAPDFPPGDPVWSLRMGKAASLSIPDRIRQLRTLRAELGRAAAAIGTARMEEANPLIFADEAIAEIAIPVGLERQLAVRKLASGFGVFARHWPRGVPLLVRQNDAWIICPSFPNATSVLLGESLPGDLMILRKEDPNAPAVIGRRFTASWDSSWSDSSLHMGDQPLRMSDATRYADTIRSSKFEFPHLAVTAAYLYEKSGDYENILRTAHYLAERDDGIVPFDLALLSASRITWEREGETWVARADFPEVSERRKYIIVGDTGPERPYFTRAGFGRREGVKLLSFVPTHGRGWSLLKYIEEFEVPEKLRDIAHKVSPRSTGALSNEGAITFLDAFQYRALEFGEVEAALDQSAGFFDPGAVEMMPDFLQVSPVEAAYTLIEQTTSWKPGSREFEAEMNKLGWEFLNMQFKHDTSGEPS